MALRLLSLLLLLLLLLGIAAETTNGGGAGTGTAGSAECPGYWGEPGVAGGPTAVSFTPALGLRGGLGAS